MADSGTFATSGAAGVASPGDRPDPDLIMPMLITGAAILFSAGSIALVMNISTAGVCRYLCGDASHWPNWITWVALVLIGLGAGIAGIAWARVKGKPNGRTMIDNYSHALIGLGFALMLLATLNFVALAGFASQGVLEAVLGNQEDLVLTRLCDKLHARVEHDHSATELAESGDDGAQAGPGDRDGGADGVQDGQGGRVGAATDAENRPLDPKLYTLRLLLLPGFAVLGAVFFVGGAMRRKRDASEKLEAIRRKNAQTANTNPNADEAATGGAAGGDKRAPNADDTADDPHIGFSNTRFWAGMWYRLGEAVLFSLVLFLLLRSGMFGGGGGGGAGESAANQPQSWAITDTSLLVMALLLGMFVKPAEQLINGLAVRLLKGVEAMVK